MHSIDTRFKTCRDLWGRERIKGTNSETPWRLDGTRYSSPRALLSRFVFGSWCPHCRSGYICSSPPKMTTLAALHDGDGMLQNATCAHEEAVRSREFCEVCALGNLASALCHLRWRPKGLADSPRDKIPDHSLWFRWDPRCTPRSMEMLFFSLSHSLSPSLTF